MERLDTLSQEQLVRELRATIDAVRDVSPTQDEAEASRRGRARQKLRRLIRENPRSVRAKHVTYNLGKERAAWMAPLIEAELS